MQIKKKKSLCDYYSILLSSFLWHIVGRVGGKQDNQAIFNFRRDFLQSNRK